jgi:polyphosphate kinase
VAHEQDHPLHGRIVAARSRGRPAAQARHAVVTRFWQGRAAVNEPSSEALAAAPATGGAARSRAAVASPESPPAAGTVPAAPDLAEPGLYLNRELSWLEFNRRVLEEALDTTLPLLERVKFLAIFGSNLDEFFMVRVSGLRRQMRMGVVEAPPDGMTPVAQLAAIREALLPLLDKSVACWREDLRPRLAEAGIHVLSYGQVKKKQRELLRRHFTSEIFPVLTPLAFDPGHPFPHISSLSLNLAVVVEDPAQGERFARLKVPDTLPRLLRIPDEEKADSYEKSGLEEVRGFNFVWLEEVVAANLDLLFPGLEVAGAYPFRLTRDADPEIEEDEGADLITAMAEVVEQRHFGSAVRLEVDSEMPTRIRNLLAQNLGLEPFQVFSKDSPIGLAGLGELAALDRPDLKDPPFLPVVPPPLAGPLFQVLRQRDAVLYHPYDSFAPTVNFVEQAANDPQVVAIKMTLYRTGPNSPIVESLMEARQNDKQVSVLVELKARFDEENNIGWARALERSGVHVVYGLLGLKTHAKICLVVRREERGIRRYVHLATGNYNPATARIYADLGYFTCDQAIAEDVSDLFNALTGYSRKAAYRKLLVAPGGLRAAILDRIEREIVSHARSGDGFLAFKMNALVDPACIRALYRASQAGVRVELQVRGICCLRPGVPGVSETIRVTSVVGRFLEHARLYYFRNGGAEELLMGSADLMPRNLDGRVEVLFPIEDERIRAAVRDDILFTHLRDNQKSHFLLPDGTYERVLPAPGEEPLDSQRQLLERAGGWRPEE